MAKIYEVRTSDDVLKATIPARIAFKLFDTKGTWRTAKYKYADGTVNQFVVGDDLVMTFFRCGEEVNMYFWEGDKINIKHL